MYHDPRSNYRQYRRPSNTSAPLALPPEFHAHHVTPDASTRTPRASSSLSLVWIVLALSVLAVLAWILYNVGDLFAHLSPSDPSGVLLAFPYFVHPPDIASEFRESVEERYRCESCPVGLPSSCSDDNLCVRYSEPINLFTLAESAPDRVRSFTSRIDAHKYASATSPKQSITFLLSDNERSNWQRREQLRFKDGDYIDLPWCTKGIARESSFDWEGDLPATTRAADHPTYAQITEVHYAHLSTQYPDMIAYTPSEEHGYQDRQVRIKAGRYIEQFLSAFVSKRQRTEWINYIRATPHGYQTCTTAEEIERAYTGQRHDSCMGHPASDYKSPYHPVRIYADSPDLRVVYIGEIDKVRARCVIWPEKKLYCRIYGDEILRVLLTKAGFTQGNPRKMIIAPSGTRCGSFEGARMPVVRDGCKVIMPYLDCATSADLSEDGKYWILRHDEKGEIIVRDADYLDGYARVSGVSADDDEEDYEDDPVFCSYDDCDSHDAGYGDGYCQYHHNARIADCYRCGETIWEDDHYEEISDRNYCSSCADRYARTCEECEETIYSLSRLPNNNLCEECNGNFATCPDHGERYDTRDREECKTCEEERETREDRDSRAFPRLGSVIIRDGYVTGNDGDRVVLPLALHGAFAVIKSLRVRGRFSVVHTPSSILIWQSLDESSTSLDLARTIALTLSYSDLDWSFTEGISAAHAEEIERVIHVARYMDPADTFTPANSGEESVSL